MSTSSARPDALKRELQQHITQALDQYSAATGCAVTSIEVVPQITTSAYFRPDDMATVSSKAATHTVLVTAEVM